MNTFQTVQQIYYNFLLRNEKVSTELNILYLFSFSELKDTKKFHVRKLILTSVVKLKPKQVILRLLVKQYLMFGKPRNVVLHASTNSFYQTVYYYLNTLKELLVIINLRAMSAKMINTERSKEQKKRIQFFFFF